MPAETLDRLAELGDRAIWVSGNCERELVAAYDGEADPALPEIARRPTEYCASRLEPRHRELIDGLPASVSLFAAENIRQVHSDAEALAAFGGR